MSQLARSALLAVAALALLAVMALPGRASAAPALKLDRACYAEGAAIAFTVAGFPPGSRLDVLAVHGAQLTSTGVRVGRNGKAKGKLRAPSHTLAQDETRARLVVTAHVLTFDTVPAVPVVRAAASRNVDLTVDCGAA
jgi:hypothetical protein